MAIAVKGLVVRYARGERPALQVVSAVFEGKHLLLGPNGSGKTTLLKTIAGIIPPDEGEALIDGRSIAEFDGVPGLLAVNFEEAYWLLQASVRDLLSLYMDIMGGDMDLALELLDLFGVDERMLRRRKLWQLSAGQRKAVCTAMALASKAKYVLLDEPFEQLDPARKLRLLERLRGSPSSLIVSTHETWTLVPLAGWSAYLMFEGRLYGPVGVRELMEAKVILGEAEDAIVSVEVAGRKVSIVRGGSGKPITDLITLDRVYELLVGRR